MVRGGDSDLAVVIAMIRENETDVREIELETVCILSQYLAN